MIMFRFSTSVRTQDNITSHFCLIARRIGTPYHQMIISGSSIGRNNNIMMMYFCILQTGNIIYLVYLHPGNSMGFLVTNYPSFRWVETDYAGQ